MKSYSLITLLLFLTSAITTQASSTAPVSETYSHPLLNQIYEMHSLAEAGNEDATRRLVAWLEELTAEQPENGILLVYLGSAYTLASRDAFIGPGKLRYLMSGRDCMDRAVALRPDDPNVRFIRGINNYHLPTLFNRRSIARDDFRKLVDQLSKNSFDFTEEDTKILHIALQIINFSEIVVHSLKILLLIIFLNSHKFIHVFGFRRLINFRGSLLLVIVVSLLLKRLPQCV